MQQCILESSGHSGVSELETISTLGGAEDVILLFLRSFRRCFVVLLERIRKKGVIEYLKGILLHVIYSNGNLTASLLIA